MKHLVRTVREAVAGIAVFAAAHVQCPRPAEAAGLSLVDRIVPVVTAFASKKDEPVDALVLASAIGVATKDPKWAALILTVGVHESALSARIARNECRQYECDAGRAFGLYQQHKNSFNAAVWGSDDVLVQTREASRALRSAFYQCNGHGKLRDDWVARTILAYSGRRCDANDWPGLAPRLRTYERIARRL